MNYIDSEDAAVKWLHDICPPPPPEQQDDSLLDKLKAVVQRFPRAIRVRTAYGCSPLYYACWRGCSNEIVQYLIECWPESVQMSDEFGSLPLHVACKNGGKSSLAVIRTLVQAWPNSIREKDYHCGFLPLHHVCYEQRGGTDEDDAVISFLIECWPKALRVKTTSGKHLPLHLALKKNMLSRWKRRPSLRTVQRLVQAWPDGVREKDGRGFLPLHLACSECDNVDHDVIPYLVECWPESLRIKTNPGGTLPLHLALQPGLLSPLATIQWLVQAWPDAVREPDDKGRLPLHTALELGCTDEVIECLVRSWPQACQIPKAEGES